MDISDVVNILPFALIYPLTHSRVCACVCVCVRERVCVRVLCAHSRHADDHEVQPVPRVFEECEAAHTKAPRQHLDGRLKRVDASEDIPTTQREGAREREGERERG